MNSDDDNGSIKNIIDGHVRTKDEKHLWLQNLENDSEFTINILFYKCEQLGLLRIWVIMI